MSRTAMLLGREAVERLEQATVAVFGLGGVGSYTAEALARAGVGRLILVDGDTVSDSNRNRQLIASLLHGAAQGRGDAARRCGISTRLPGVRLTPCFICPGRDRAS